MVNAWPLSHYPCYPVCLPAGRQPYGRRYLLIQALVRLKIEVVLHEHRLPFFNNIQSFLNTHSSLERGAPPTTFIAPHVCLSSRAVQQLIRNSQHYVYYSLLGLTTSDP
jgi:hypothetical protein